MTKRKSALILLASLIMICLCISAVSAANTTDNTTLSNTNTTNAISVDNNQANTINLEQNNKTVDKSINTNKVSTIDLNQKTENNLKTVENAGSNVTASSWNSLSYYCQKTDGNYVITLAGTNFDATTLITFANNATIIGTAGSYITCTNSSLTPFLNNNEDLTINFVNVTFKNMDCTICAQLNSNSNSSFENCTFNNITTRSGRTSVVYNTYGFMNLIACNFTNCFTGYGAITNYNTPTTVSMNVTKCKFENNTASVEPGAINNCGLLNVTNSTFINNHANWWAGAIHTHSNAYTRIVDSNFTGNTAGWNGGALYTYSKLEVYNTTFENNNCTTNNGGGAIGAYNYGSTYNITVENSTFKDNNNLCGNLTNISTTSLGRGGAISVLNGGYLNVHNSTFIHNGAVIGQAICAYNTYYDNSTGGTPYLQMYNNTFINHTSTTNDTVYISAGNYTFENNTFINSPQTQYNSNNNYNVVLNSNLNSLLTKNLLSLTAVNTTPLSDEIHHDIIYVNRSGDENFFDSNVHGQSWDDAFHGSGCYAWALEIINNNGIIYLADGTYTELSNPSTGNNFMTIGQSRNSTIFKGLFYCYGPLGSRNCAHMTYTYVNLTVLNSTVSLDNDREFYNVTFINSKINIGKEYYQSIDSRDGTPNNTFFTNFHNCSFINCSVNDSFISVYSYTGANFHNCTFSNITASSLVSTSSDGGRTDGINLTNCVFDNCNVTSIADSSSNIEGLVVIDNCWYGSNNVTYGTVSTSETLNDSTVVTHNYVNCTGSHVVANLTNSTPIVYNNPTTFNVVFSSLNEDGTVNTGANFTGFPSVPVNYTINGENILGNIVDGVSEVNYTLVNDKTPVTAIVNNQSLSLALPKMISESEINITVPSTGTTGTAFTVTSNVTTGATGNVTYYVNGVAVSTLSVGKAFTYTPSKAGTYNVSATYNGDDTYASSSTGNSSIVVSDPYIPPTPVPTPSSTSLVNSFINNTLTITLTSGNTGLNGKTVTVTVKGENTTTYKLTTGTDGKAVLDLNNLTSGTYTVSDNFVGNSAYASSSTTSTINITHPVVNNNVTVTVANITGDAGANTTINVNLTYVNGTNVNTGNVTVNVNGKNYTSTVVNGTSSIPITLPTNSGNVTVTYTNGNYSTSVNVPVTVKTVSNVTVLTADNLTETFGQGQNFTGYLKDIYGNPIIGQHIAINLTRLSNGLSKVYWVTTDTNGAYQLQINLGLGAYSAKVSYAGKGNYTASPDANASIIVNSADSNKTITTLTADKFNHKFGAGENFTGKLINPSTNQPIIGQHIAINLTRLSNGLSKVYWVTTDTNGEYQLAINLGLGNYTAACSYAGTSAYQASNASNTITVTA